MNFENWCVKNNLNGLLKERFSNFLQEYYALDPDLNVYLLSEQIYNKIFIIFSDKYISEIEIIDENVDLAGIY